MMYVLIISLACSATCNVLLGLVCWSGARQASERRKALLEALRRNPPFNEPV